MTPPAGADTIGTPRVTPLRPPLVPRLLAGTLLALAAACGPRGPESAAPGRSAAASPTPEAPGAVGNASITGRAIFEGEAPENPRIDPGLDPTCAAHHPHGLVQEEVLVSADHGLANVFVWVRSGVVGRYPPPSVPVRLDQRGCLYVPRVFGIQTGQALEIVNSDETLHNVHAAAERNDAFNFGMRTPGATVTRRFDAPEVLLRIKCDVHSWMRAWAGVVSHPFHAVSGLDGAFRVSGLPGGTYTLGAVHETLGETSAVVTVGANETATVTFTFRPRT